MMITMTVAIIFVRRTISMCKADSFLISSFQISRPRPRPRPLQTQVRTDVLQVPSVWYSCLNRILVGDSHQNLLLQLQQ